MARPAVVGQHDGRDIAIVGMACRLPGGIEDPTALWQLLEEERCAVGTLPDGRWQWPEGVGPDTHPGIDRGGFVADAGSFEAPLFRITPYEAQRMDPQQRWMLELAWACLENAGYPASAVAGAPMGVFVGASGSDYQRTTDTDRLPVRAHSALATSMAIIANRVSYFYDLRGPSVQLDTACSSSLVAVHSAVRALRAGECTTALVGGVNLLCHPANSIAYHQAGMLSPDGLCKTFDESANGYVRSEGGAVLLLKPLAAALDDGDHVHAVIKGSATNHGGQAGGLTVPSASMQASLVRTALADAGVAASDISYVEAHGTGTALGDPIEVQGLARAFEGSGAPCAIGSVKTNLGHLEAAAGITGLMKIVLSMRHRKLPASLHFSRLNPKITLEGTPFSVAQRLADWELDGRPARLAGVSSFGSGGSNAHVIVAQAPVPAPAPAREEAAGHGEPASAERIPSVVVLSAETEPQLVRQAELLLAHLRCERPTDAGLRDLAYTTQVGREALSERLGLLPTDVASLESLLGAFVSGDALPPAVLRGRAKRSGATTPVIGSEGSESSVGSVGSGRSPGEVLAAWVRGAKVDWEALHRGADRPRRVPLPTHAFAKKRYWLDRAAAVEAPKRERRHPLLQREAAAGGTEAAAFVSTFTPRDPFLRDHRVGGEPVLPAVAYLEMAREALDRTLPATADGAFALCLENVVWARPVVVRDEERTVHTVLTGGSGTAGDGPGTEAGAADRVSYTIRTGPLSEGAHVVHSRGVGSRRRVTPPAPLPVEELKSRMRAAVLEADDYYAELRAAGLDYGGTHRAVRSVHLGEGELLALLTLPADAVPTLEDYVLHPSVLDGALQAAFAPELHAAAGPWRAPLPFALDRLDVFAATPVSAYVWIREVPGASSQVRRRDLDLCDEQGRIFASLRGYSMRKNTEPAGTAATGEVTLFRPVWREQPAVTSPSAPDAAFDHTARLVLACGFEDRLGELRALAPHLSFVEPPEENEPAAALRATVAQWAVELLRTVKGLLLGRPAGPVLLQVLTPSHGEGATYQALSGLLRTARLENPALVGQVIAVPADSPAPYLVAKLEEDARSSEDHRISHAEGARRTVLDWEPLPEAGASADTGAEGPVTPRPVRWRAGGVYLITGGAGGLGPVFAEEIARRAKGAVICLTGRSPLSPEKDAVLAALRAEGAEAEYHVLDAADGPATGRLVVELVRRHGALHGVIHAAGVIQDNFLTKKPVAEFRRVLAPKLDGCRHLDEATKDADLDFFVLFSSIMGATGNVGQGDYAVANAFLDEFARRRGALVDAGRRSGRTVAIGWPLWHSGGMGADEATRRALRVRSGLLPMTTEAGVAAFHRALISGETHVVVGAGEEARLQALLNGDEERSRPDGPAAHLPATPAAGASTASGAPAATTGSGAVGAGGADGVDAAGNDRALEARTVRFLKEELSRITQLPLAELDQDEPLGSYGMDSILATELTAGLETTFGSLSKTLLFEYHTLAELGAYFRAGHRATLDTLFARTGAPAALPAAETAVPSAPVPSAPVPSAAVPSADAVREVAHGAGTPQPAALDIAVIGLSGRYPQSRDLREYWQNLRDGRDCVVEVPADRWDWRAYYSEDRARPGRHYSRWGGFIAEVDRFDPLFFNISPHEADYLDPQERLFLEHAWTAMEDAGYTRERLRHTGGEAGDGQVGVYAGVMWGQYQLLFPGGDAIRGNPNAIGSSYASVANRVSFVMNLHGPSMTVDTMCSSSLTAVELACRDLRRGRTKMAFAGGVNVTVHPNKYLALSTGQFISGKGHCESFGVGGDGYIPGEGVGVVLLKPLHDAERDGDHIYGVIKGSALSHGGRTNGYTVPNPRAQQAAIHGALREAGVDPRAVSYVEAHGTGTKLGDPIEITGLSQAFRTASAPGAPATAAGGDSQYCYLGSAKSNIGHCESAAGIAGLTKVLLQLQHGRIAPSLHSATLNPDIDFTRTPFVVNQELRDWERPVVDGRTHPRIAGISSFGAGGSNAHLVVAEHVDLRPAPSTPTRTPLLFPLSAKNEERLRAYAVELLRFAREADAAASPRTTPADLAHTLQAGREAMDERLGVIADSFAALAGKLERYLAGEDSVEGLYRGNAKRDRQALSFIPAEELAESLDKLAQRGKTAELLGLWVRGAAPDWQRLHPRTTPAPRMISAPTYPFARERHWIPETAQATEAGPETRADSASDTRPVPVRTTATVRTTDAAADAGPSAGLEPPARAALFLTKQWRPAPSGTARTRHTAVVVLHDRSTRRLAEALSALFDDATLLEAVPGAETALAQCIGRCSAWIDLTGMAVRTGGDGTPGADAVDGISDHRPSGRALALLQSALDAKASRDIRLLYVTQGLETPDASAPDRAHAPAPASGPDGGRVDLAGAARAALYRLLQSEYRGLTSCHADLDPAVREDAELAAVIHRELGDGSGEAEVCYRAGVRHAPVLEESAPVAARTARPVFADDEVLLVTGGTRGLGLLCARHLVEHYGVRRLVLTGREALPPRARWADACPPSVREKIDAVLALEARGVEVRVLALPLDRADEVAAGIATIEATLGRVTGVLHAAGLVDTRNPAFVRKPVPDIARVVSPKIEGTRNLLAALDARSLRFAVLFSSVSGVVPTLGVGQSDYAMGNAFMDYFARAHAADLPITSVQWPSWQEAGFGEVTNQAYTDTGLLSITNAEGLAFLDEILAVRRGPVVMPVRVGAGLFDPGALLAARPAAPAAPAPRPPAAAAATAPVSASASVAVPAPTPTADGPLVRRLTDFLSGTFEGQLKLKPGLLDAETSYADYGADSILLAQVLQQIRQRLDVRLDPSVLLEYPTLSELATWLLNTYPTEIAARFGDEPQHARPDKETAEGVDEKRPGAPEDGSPAASPAPAGPAAGTESPAPAGPAARTAPASRAAVAVAEGEGEGEGDGGRGAAVAVIGMACRLPGAPGVDAYWDLLSQGRSAVREVPTSRWGRPTGFHAGLIDDVFGFDPGYFMLHAEDVRAMDPQALVLLEESLKAVHHAGYRLGELDGTRTGVYVGARSRGLADDALVGEARNPIMAVGQNYLAANVSQFFNWHGPAMVMDTACSSSLVAMKVATDALAAGSVDLALVAGVSLLADPSAHELFRRRGLLREDGEFHIFDRRAGGVVLGEGAGVVVLKPLAQAERDGDTVYAVVEGVAINNDGRTAGPATPNLATQKEVMREALRQAGCRPDQVAYLDVNGSGSEMTDLLELKAVEAVYGQDRTGPLRLGSMKPNIGHPLCAEGIAAFIKVALMVHHQRMVPFLSGVRPMEHYTPDPARLGFPRHAGATELPYAALSSFADGGTNGHVVVGHHVPRLPVRRRPVELPELNRTDVRTGERVGAAASPMVWTRRIDARDAVLDGHRVYGRRLLPGLAWIDLLYGCFAEVTTGFAHRELSLRDVTIYRPLAVDADGAVEIRVEARAETPDTWRITVTDAPAQGPGAGPVATPYVTAGMHRATGGATGFGTGVPGEVRTALRDPDGRVRDLEEIYRDFRAQELVHSGLMKAVGAAYTGADDIWLRVAVDERAASRDRGERLFHPALIDGSAVAACAVVLGEAQAGGDPADGEQRLFLPLHYASFRADASLGRACYTRVRRESVELREELLTFTMEFFDIGGHRIGELADLTTKVVRDAGHIDPARRDDGPGTGSAARAGTGTGTRTGAGSVSGTVAAPDRAGSADRDAALPPSDGIGAAVTSVLAAQLGVPANQVGMHTSYYALGLDSATLLRTAGEIGERLGTRLSPTLLFEHPTAAELVAHLVRHHRPGPTSPARPAEPVAPAASVAPVSSVAPVAPAVGGGEPPTGPVREHDEGDIAVVGMAGRYPKAANVAEFWENLKAGRDCVTEVPESRWPRDTFEGERTPSGRKMSAWGGFVDDVDRFDAEFFGIPADEAVLLDPQERMFLEVCWEAIEDAGYTPAGLTASGGDGPRRAVGVFAGVMHKDYVLVQHEAARPDGRTGRGPAPLSLNAASIANRVSHFCDFSGPSMAVDTVCASSLSAVHLAVESLRRGECRAALAGGVNLSLHPGKYRTYGALELLASEAPARSFGAGGDGYVSAEGVGAVLLKPLASALADGDAVYAVIKGSAVNHSGRTPGIRVPSVAAQAALIEDCLNRAGVDPGSLGCLEAHGTGTEIGDLIEIQALRRAFEKYTDAKRFCSLGSVKSAIGHAEAAAGISGLTKAVLQLHHRTLTPLVRVERTNPYLDLDDSPFRLQTELEEWPAGGPGTPRRAGVSAFGATGANAHIVLEEAPPVTGATARDARGGRPAPVLVPLSATDGERLRAYAAKLARFLETEEGAAADLAALAHTLRTGRVALAERAVILAYGLDELRSALDGIAWDAGTGAGNVWRGRGAEQLQDGRLLDEDDLRAELVRRWSAQGKWDKIAELWLSGYTVDWGALHDTPSPRRLHLPTYPFAGQRHWVTPRRGEGRASEGTPAATTEAMSGVPVADVPVSGSGALADGVPSNSARVAGPVAPVPVVPARSAVPDGVSASAGVPEGGGVHWRFVPEDEELPAPSVDTARPGHTPEEKARGFLRQLVAARLGRPVSEIDAHTGLIAMGLTSLGAVGLTRDLAATVDPGFLPSTLFEHGTVAELAAHLAARGRAPLSRLVAARTEEQPRPQRPERAEGPQPEVLAVLERLETGALHLDDAIALLDTGRNEK
ncbi:SDR family NAD(P)-dependent oxidoreductase [Streptomyces sp. NPDC003016]